MRTCRGDAAADRAAFAWKGRVCHERGCKAHHGALVERYAPLIWSICRRRGLDGAGAGDAGHSVWLLLADHLGNLRDPAALPGWLATTTGRECGRVLRAARGPLTAGHAPDPQTHPVIAAPNGWGQQRSESGTTVFMRSSR